MDYVFKGTRGPWKLAGKSQSGKSNFNIIGSHIGGNYKIARVPFVVIDDPNYESLNLRQIKESEKNAKAIAAMPDLLAACIEVVKTYEGDGMENMGIRDHVFYNTCKSAILAAL